MTSKKQIIDEFLNGFPIAVIGVSENSKKFGTIVFNEFVQKGYKVFPVNPNYKMVAGQKCYPDVLSINEKFERAVIIIPSDQTEIVVKDCLLKGIKYIWMQQGAESETAAKFCIENGINLIKNECVLMYLQPVVGFHRFHRTIWKWIGRLPS